MYFAEGVEATDFAPVSFEVGRVVVAKVNGGGAVGGEEVRGSAADA